MTKSSVAVDMCGHLNVLLVIKAVEKVEELFCIVAGGGEGFDMDLQV